MPWGMQSAMGSQLANQCWFGAFISHLEAVGKLAGWHLALSAATLTLHWAKNAWGKMHVACGAHNFSAIPLGFQLLHSGISIGTARNLQVCLVLLPLWITFKIIVPAPTDHWAEIFYSIHYHTKTGLQLESFGKVDNAFYCKVIDHLATQNDLRTVTRSQWNGTEILLHILDSH